MVSAVVRQFSITQFLFVFVLALCASALLVIQMMVSTPFLMGWTVLSLGCVFAMTALYPHRIERSVRTWMFILSPLILAFTLPYVLARHRWGI